MGIDTSTQSTTSTSHQPLLTAREIAAQLRVSVGQVYRLARMKRIPAHHLGHAVRFDLADVLKATATRTLTIPAGMRRPAQQIALARLQTRARTQRRIV